MQVILLRLVILTSLLLLAFIVSADPVEYVIYPVDKIEEKDIKDLVSDINSLAGGANKVYTSIRVGRQIPSYWVAPLSGEALDALKRHPLVEDVILDEELVEPFVDGEWGVQQSAPEELRVVSWPPFSQSLDHYPNFVYPPNPLHEKFIYHVELGINEGHDDFQGRNIEWLFTPRTIQKGLNIKNESPYSGRPGHSTCTASKATGNSLGAARFATLVVVKMPDLRTGSIAEVFQLISDDINAKNRGNWVSVVSVSWGSKQIVDLSSLNVFWSRLQSDIQELWNLRVDLFCAAGNEAESDNARGAKRLLADTAPANFVESGLLAIANCDSQGAIYRTSQVDPRIQIGAPGVNIRCARHDSRFKTRISTGTSYSAPLAAGAVASVPHGYGTRVGPSGMHVFWNGADDTTNPPSQLLLGNTWLNFTSNLTAFQNVDQSS